MGELEHDARHPTAALTRRSSSWWYHKEEHNEGRPQPRLQRVPPTHARRASHAIPQNALSHQSLE